MIKHLVFDMGQVLVPFKPRQHLAEYVSDPEDLDLLDVEIFQSAEWIQGDRGTITPEEAVASICKRLPERLHNVVAEMYAHWAERLRPPFPDMEELVAELKELGYGVYLLSNTSKAFHHFRQFIPAVGMMDGVFASADFQLLKPDPEIFRTFWREFDLKAEECFFIDDSPANIECAAWLGMQGFIYRRNTPALRKALQAVGVPVRDV